MQTTGNTIFIPGATSGIGLGLALRFHRAGNRVIIGGRRKHLIEQITRDHPGIEGVLIDTADQQSITDASREVISRFPETNVLIMMAGIMRPEDFHSSDFLPTAEATVTTNLLGPLRLIAAFVDHLSARPDPVIITVSSGLASVPLAFTPTYNATKAAIHMLSEGVRLQLADTAVQVIELVPPSVATDLMPGHRDDPNAMDLDEYLDETMALLAEQPDAREILVERVKLLRFAEVRGDYDRVVAALNGGHVPVHAG